MKKELLIQEYIVIDEVLGKLRAMLQNVKEIVP